MRREKKKRRKRKESAWAPAAWVHFPVKSSATHPRRSRFPRDWLKFYEDDSGNPSKSTLNVLYVALALQSRCGRRDGMTRESRIKLYSEETTQRRWITVHSNEMTLPGLLGRRTPRLLITISRPRHPPGGFNAETHPRPPAPPHQSRQASTLTQGKCLPSRSNR